VTGLGPRCLAEGLGSALLVAAVVGSGISAARLGGDPALVLLANAVATGAALVALITVLAPLSGAHLNPVVTLVTHRRGGIPGRAALAYVGAQIVGGLAGVVAANLMFGLAPLAAATKARGGAGVWFGEVLATIGLLLFALGGRPRRPEVTGFVVGAYITGAYFFTSSTSFANPAVTVARSLTDSYTGIAPRSVPAFLGAQLLGAVVFVLLAPLLSGDAHTLEDTDRPVDEEAT